MTRFEALGVLPDKKITCYTKIKNDDGEARYKIAWRSDIASFIDQLPADGMTFNLVSIKNRPDLNYLIKFIALHPKTQHFIQGYLKTDKRKVKRFAKRFDLPLPPISERLNRPTTSIRA